LYHAVNTGSLAIVQRLIAAKAIIYDGNSSQAIMAATFSASIHADIIRVLVDAVGAAAPPSFYTVCA
jgi:hypothetical protein